MFKEGSIIYFNPFYFKNGNTSKAKYFVVLKNNEGNNIIASLPTRKDAIPESNVVENGCVELPQINFNCFVISRHIEITTCGKTFDFTTHIYGHEVDSYEIESLNELYPLENIDYELWGEMKNDIFENLIHCLKNSKIVKRKYKRLL
ncbi:MAG: hypothetical protein ACPGSD_00170 [Flavobacteriales bacterium]